MSSWFGLFLLVAAITLVFVIEVRQAPAESVDAHVPPLQRNRRVFLRLIVTGGVAAFVPIATAIAVHFINPEGAEAIVASPIRWVFGHPYSLLLCGVAIYLVALLCGVRQRQPVLLFCLTLPWLIAVPLALLVSMALTSHMIEAFALVPIVFFIQPASWILLFIGIGQASLLRKPEGNFTPGGFARVFLIAVAYLCGTIY